MNCEMCGRNIENPYDINVEGVIMQLCKNCIRFGTIINKPKNIIKANKIEIKKDEIIEIITEDFANKIKNARESRKLMQKDLAKEIGVKESLIHKLESGNMEPSLDLAKKFERFLNIRLIEKQKEDYKKIKSERNSLTIGDILNIKQ